MNADLHGVDMLPTDFFGGHKVTEEISIFRDKAAGLICYFCTHGEKEGMIVNNGVICQHPQSSVFGRITAATNTCDKNSES